MNVPRAESPDGTRARSLAAKGRAAPPPALRNATEPDPAMVSHATRVLCVDDHAVLVEGLRALFAINGDIEIIGRLPSAAGLVEEVRRLKPGAVLLDIEMPGPDAFEVADRLKRAHPSVRVIILSAYVRDAYISAAFNAGISGYFCKSDELDDIVQGIREVMRSKPGSFALGPKVRQRCRPAAERAVGVPIGAATAGALYLGLGAPVTLLESLTPREAEILRLIGKGLSRVQIGAQLSRSVKTIDGHQDRMMKKLGIATRADLMRFAIREGLAQA